MKILLLQNVDKVGKRGEMKEVSDGYGRNFLLKNHLAELANDNSLKVAIEEKQKTVRVKEMEAQAVAGVLAKLSEVKITITGKASEEGVLFAGIKAVDISRYLKEKTGLIVEPLCIKLDKPIKALGEHEVSVAIQDKQTKVKIVIERSQ